MLVVAAGQATHSKRVTLQSNTTLDVPVAPAPPTRITPTQPSSPVQADITDIIQTVGPNFTLNRRPFRFVGANIRGLLHYGDTRLLRHSHPHHRDVQLDAAKAMGARVVRIFLANRHSTVTETADRLEQALALAAARDLYLLIAFTDVHGDTGFNPAGDEKFYSLHGKLNRTWFEGGYREHYLPLVEHVVRRFQGHKRVFAWELGNELKAWEEGRMLPDLFIEFASTVSKRIRELDAVHLIGTGIINSGNLGANSDQARRLNSLSQP